MIHYMYLYTKTSVSSEIDETPVGIARAEAVPTERESISFEERVRTQYFLRWSFLSPNIANEQSS